MGSYRAFYTDWSIISFYGSHIINCAGNGGMLCLNDDEMYVKAKLLFAHGEDPRLFLMRKVKQ